MDQYAGTSDHSTYCYAELAASFISFLSYGLPSSGFYGAGKDNRGRHNLSGHHSIRTISAPTSIIPHFTLNAISVATIPIYPGLGQAPNNAGLHTQWLG